jgi:ribonuclease inhibitor
MEKIIIDGNKYQKIEEIHSFLKNKLSFPEYYGNNLNALWDMLTAWVKFPLSIEWISYDISLKKIGKPAEMMREFFEEAENDLKGFKFILIK